MKSIRKYSIIPESKFVGRDRELAELRGHLDDSVSGQGRLVFVIGEAGIGKSRLITELAESIESEDIMTLFGRCLYDENTEPYLPFIDAFGKYISGRKKRDEDFYPDDAHSTEDFYSMGLVGIAESAPVASDYLPVSSDEQGDLVPMGLLPLDDEDLGVHPSKIKEINLQQERTRLFESLSQLVNDISKEKPLLVILEDLQWADDGSLQLLHYLARNIQNSRVMITCSYRPEEIENIKGEVHPLSKTLRRMRPEKLFFEIALERFDENDTAQMIQSLLKIQNIPEAFTRRLYGESEGNPFFIEEVLKSLVNEGLINPNDYSWDNKFDPSKIHIPSTIRDVIGRRMDRLDDKTRGILSYASVIGNKFTFETLHKLSDLNEEELVDSVDTLIAANIILEDSSSTEEVYKFNHTQIREVIYNSMSRSRRRLMHKRIGHIIEKLNKNKLDDVVYSLARHFYEGKDTEKTITYSIRAGEKATKAFAPEDALTYYNMALEALKRLDETDENKQNMIFLLKRLGEISFNLSEWKPALEYYKKAIELCEDTESEGERAECLRKTGYVLNRMGKWKLATKNFEKSLSISRKLDDKFGIADAHRGIGYIHWRLGEYDDAIAHYNECIQFSMEIGDMHTIALAFIELGNVYIETGDIDKAIEYYNKSLKNLEPIGDYSEMARAYNNLGDSYLKSGQYDLAIEYFEKCEEMGRKIGRKDIVGWSLFNSGEAWAQKGESDRALECAEKSMAILSTVGDQLGIQACYKIFGMAYGAKKQWDKSIENFNICVQMGKENNVPYIQGEIHYYFGRMLKEKGDFAEAKAQFEAALKIFSNLETKEFVEKIQKELEGL